MEELLIRNAVPFDAEAVGRIHIASWQAAYRTILPEDRLSTLSVADRVRHWERNLATASAETFVAQRGGAVIGFASIGRSRDPEAVPGETAELWALYVDPEVWGHGTGWRLWREARDRALRHDYSEMTLWVLEDNQRGRRFYERQGCVLDPGWSRSVELLDAQVPEVRYRLRFGARPLSSRSASRPPGS